MTIRTTLTEAVDLTAAPEGNSGRLAVQIITPGWGTSGYYSPQVLEAAAGARVFPAGTQMFMDHPTESERYERPERSVRDLAAVLTEDARWDGAALTAPVQVFAPYRDVVTEMADVIGVSIRATAEVTENGEAEGRRGPIITELVEGLSVDFVTTAGRGGRVLQVLEAARSHARQVAEALPGNLTADDLRRALRDVVRSAYAADETWVYVQDFTDELVYFTVETEDATATYQQGYAADDNGALSLSGERVEVRVETRYVPVTPAGQSTTTQESEEDTMPQIEEARLRQLEADAGRVTTLEAERDTAQRERDDALRRLAESRARNTATVRARQRVTEANAALAPATVDRIVTQATVTVPLTEAGQLDEAAFDAAVDAARTAEETYLATLAEASGAGRVRGFGGHTDPVQLSEADIDRDIAAAFGRQIKEA